MLHDSIRWRRIRWRNGLDVASADTRGSHPSDSSTAETLVASSARLLLHPYPPSQIMKAQVAVQLWICC